MGRGIPDNAQRRRRCKGDANFYTPSSHGSSKQDAGDIANVLGMFITRLDYMSHHEQLHKKVTNKDSCLRQVGSAKGAINTSSTLPNSEVEKTHF